MFPPISESKRRRKRLGISQVRLAELSGVSQDTISRVENGRIKDPSYTTIKKLFESIETALASSQESDNYELTAEAIMSCTIVSVRPSDYADRAWDLMKSNNFSQLPVIDATGKVVGGVSETELTRIGSAGLASKTKVEDLISDAFPIVGKTKKISKLRSILLEGNEPAVIVMEKGRAIGIVTKSDLIDAVFSKQPQLLK